MEFCSQIAKADNATLYGTVSDKSQVWALVEYSGKWPKGATKSGASLPGALFQWIEAQRDAISGFRPILIKRKTVTDTKSVFIAIPGPTDAKLYQFQISSYEELSSLDINTILAGGGETQRLLDEQVVLVCTNGLHDNCCSMFGLPVYDAFEKDTSLNVWQSSHIGGHRYAATAAVFPSGVYYGYLAPSAVVSVGKDIDTKQIALQYYRGRSFQPAVVNAADYFLRNVLSLTADAAVKLSNHEADDAVHLVTFLVADQLHQIEVETVQVESVLASCDGPAKSGQQFKFVAHHQG